MDDLINRYFTGELTDLESGRLKAWRKASPENEARFQELVRIWELTDPDNASGRAKPPTAWEAVVAEAERRRELPAEPAHQRNPWRWVAAAMAVFAISGGWLAWHEINRPTSLAAAEFKTGERETVTVTLNDGSFVRLGAKSRLTLKPSSSSRDLWLEGRAYFAVAKDPTRPFQVHTRSGNATALGTRFEVRVEQDDLRVAVVEGRVALAAGSERVEVGAGEVSHVRSGVPPSVMKVDDIHALLDWPNGLLVFQATPLPQVARELERHFGVKMVLVNPSLADRQVTAWFENEKLEVVLTTVCRVTQTSCALKGNVVKLSP